MSTIITRNSATSGSTPSSLVQGELAINVTDGRLFYGSGSGNVVKEFTGSASGGTTSPGGPNQSVQFNRNGAFSGSNNFTFNSASNALTLTGSLNITGSTLQIGNNTLLGNTTLSGSIIISGSTTTPATPTIKVYGDMETDGVIKFMPVSKTIDTSVSASYIYVSGSTNDLYFSQNASGYNNVTRLRWLEGNLYTGLLHGGLITTQSSTVYRISSGSGIIVNLNASLIDDPYPVIQFLEWGNLSASIAPLTASFQQAFVGIDSTGNIFAQGTPFSNGQFDTVINIGGVFFQNQSTINGVKTQPSVAYGFEQQQNVFNRAFGPLKLSGYTLAPSSSSTLSLIVASGTAYAPGSNYTVDPNEPYYTVDNGTNVSKIFRYHQSGSTWIYNTNGGAGFTTIDPGQYSNNGTLTTVQPNDWSIQRVFWFPNSVIKAIVVYYGNQSYSTEADAIANISIESFVEAPNTAANAVYLGAIIIRGNGVLTTPADFTIVPGGLFRQVGGSGGGGSIITQTLSGLSDVLISGPTNGQPLVYNNTSGKWQNSSTLTANLTGNASTATSASFASTASYVLQAVSASFAPSTPAFPFTGSALITGSLGITGSLTVTTGITGSLLGTSSYAAQALSASFASTASLANSVRVFSTFTPGFYPVTFVSSSANGLLYQYQFSSFYYNPGNDSLNVSNITSSLFGTASFATQALSASWAPGGGNAFPYTGSAEITGSLTVTGSFSVNNGTNVKLDTATSTLTDDSNISSVDWQNRISYDTTQLQSIDWRNRDLTDINESASLNWSSRIMRDSGAPGGSGFSVSSIDWENRQAYDTVGNVSIDWSAGNLTDTSGNSSINWIGRSQYDSTNNSIIDYSGNNGRNIANFRPTIEISSPTTQDEFIATTTGFGSIASNFAGKLIEVGPNIDLAVTASNTVFLDTDGVWKLVDQSTDNTTKLLGICTNGYVRGAILIDGIVTVTTSSAIIDVPYVRGSNFYGMPVYLTGSQSSLTTTKPTSGYVRVIGHMYYNSPTTPDYWIMKFNPSNDWYEI
jgi:hypothetical protein